MSAYADGTFDAVLDKGTLDAVLCGAQAIENVTLMLLEVARSVAPHITLVCTGHRDTDCHRTCADYPPQTCVNLSKVPPPTDNHDTVAFSVSKGSTHAVCPQ